MKEAIKKIKNKNCLLKYETKETYRLACMMHARIQLWMGEFTEIFSITLHGFPKQKEKEKERERERETAS